MEDPRYEDEYGFVGPMPLTSSQRKLRPEAAPTGPDIGSRLPDFELTDHTGHRIRLHEDRGSSKAAVVFFRSAVW